MNILLLVPCLMSCSSGYTKNPSCPYVNLWSQTSFKVSAMTIIIMHLTEINSLLHGTVFVCVFAEQYNLSYLVDWLWINLSWAANTCHETLLSFLRGEKIQNSISSLMSTSTQTLSSKPFQGCGSLMAVFTKLSVEGTLPWNLDFI